MNLIGQKVIGFYYDPLVDGPKHIRNPLMDEHIGKIGTILGFNTDYPNNITIEFDNGRWLYPIELTKKHLVDPLSVIPKLTSYLTMQVSNDNENWYDANIIAQLPNGNYITDALVEWKYISNPLNP